jgi:uncharacterized protein
MSAIILPLGSVNPNGLTAPGVYISEQLPANNTTGVPTNIIGFVGTASWGPVNSPTTVFGMNGYTAQFGFPENLPYDMGTQVMCAASLGAEEFVCVRVTDGTDTKATIDVVDVTTPTAVTGLVATSVYTGSFGNNINISIARGTNYTSGTPLYKVTVTLPIGSGTAIPEVYDNIGGTGLALWQNMVNAINMGQGALTGPSQYITAAIGTSTAAPEVAAYVLAGGTDGNTTITDATLIGSDTFPRSGMYAMAGANASLMVLCAVTTAADYITQYEFGQTNAMYAITVRPESELYPAAVTAKVNAGINSPWCKILIGDWVRIQDNYNNVQRYVSPQGFASGVLDVTEPQLSGLNKPIVSQIFLGTQSSDANVIYTNTDIAAIRQNGLDVIATPSPAGNYFSLQTGANTSSNTLANQDNFPVLTDFIAESLGLQLAPYIGNVASPTVLQNMNGTCVTFLKSLATQGIIGADDGSQPFAVNFSTLPGGIVVANIQVAYFSVIAVILVNLQTGLSTVASITPQTMAKITH